MTPDPKALHESGRHTEALALYQQIAAEPNHHPNIHYNIAVQLQKLRRFPEELQALTTYLRLCPADHKGWHNAGCCLREMGNHRGALVMFQEELKRAPGFPDFKAVAEAHHNISRTMWLVGPFDRALVHAELAVGLDPKVPEYRASLGELQLSCGQMGDGWVNYDARFLALKNRAGEIQQEMHTASVLRRGTTAQLSDPLTTEHDAAHSGRLGAEANSPVARAAP